MWVDGFPSSVHLGDHLISGLMHGVGCEWQCFSACRGSYQFWLDMYAAACKRLHFFCICGPVWFGHDVYCSLWVAMLDFLDLLVHLTPDLMCPTGCKWWCFSICELSKSLMMYATVCEWLCFLYIYWAISLLIWHVLQAVGGCASLHLEFHLTFGLMCTVGCEWLYVSAPQNPPHFWFDMCCRL